LVSIGKKGDSRFRLVGSSIDLDVIGDAFSRLYGHKKTIESEKGN